jgi:hypothetical protein
MTKTPPDPPESPPLIVHGQCQHLRHPERALIAAGPFAVLRNEPGRRYHGRDLQVELCTLCAGIMLGRMTEAPCDVALTWPDGSTAAPEAP